MSSHYDYIPDVEVKPLDKSKFWKLWKIAGILAIVTIVEFIMAKTLTRGYGLVAGFVILTIVKAYYIVSEFMHLGHEVKGLVYGVVLPMMFICWFITACIMEAHYLMSAAFNLYEFF